MKKVVVILGIVAATGTFVLLVVIFAVFTAVRRDHGEVLYSCVGEWTRTDEFAHAGGKTNYIVFADGQLAMYRDAQKKWTENAGDADLSRLQKMQADAYTTMDHNIKNGLNPLAYLDDTNVPTANPTESPDPTK